MAEPVSSPQSRPADPAVAAPADAWYHALFDVTPSATLVTDAAGRCIDANRAACALLGYARDELMFVHAARLIAAAAGWKRAQRDRLLCDGRWCGEVMLRRKDGSPVTVEAELATVASPAGARYIAVLHRSPGRARTDEEIVQLRRDLEHRITELETVLRVVPVGIGIAHDPEARQITVNPAFAQMLSISPERNASLSAPAEERPANFRVFHKGRELSADELPLQRAAAHGISTSDFEAEVVHDGGTEVSLLEYAVPLYDEHGEIRGSVGAFLDITARKRAEEALRHSEARFRSLVQNGSDIILIVDEGGIVRYLSPSAKRLLGYDPDAYLGADAFSFIHPDDGGRIRAAFADVLRRPGDHHPNEFRLRHADGSWRRIEATVANLLDDPAVRGVVATLRDVTERGVAEDALRRSEARNRALISAIPDAMFRISGDGVFLDFAPAQGFETLLPPAEFLGRHVLDVLPEDLARATIRSVERTLKSGAMQVFEYRVLVNGRLKDYESRLVPGGPAEVLSIVRDITERKQADESLRLLDQASKALASSLDYETTLASVARLAVPQLADWCSVDLVEDDGEIRRLVVAARDPAKEALVRGLRARYPFDPASPRGVPHVLRTGQPEIVHQVTDEQLVSSAVDADHLRMLRELGMTSYLRAPLMARGRTLGVLSFISSESGRRYGLDHLGLVLEVARRAALAVDNARLYKEAREALGVRDEFLSSISHQLRTPLTSIKAFAQLLQRRAHRGGEADSTVDEALASITTAATKMNALVDGLLDLSRVQTGRPLVLDRRRTDLVALARQVADEYQQTSHRHELRVDARAGRLVGVYDAARLEWVLSNLISNAIKYSPEGGVVIVTVSDEAGDGMPDRWAVLTVQDQGIGIPSTDLAHVFDRFHRGSNVGRIPGTGIGLAMTRDIVEQHGGTIAITSAVAAGTAVTVRLPCG